MPQPANAAELFNRLLPNSLLMFPDKAREVNAVYAFKINGEGGGEWTCNLTSNPPTCTRGARENVDCTVEVAHEDFMSMLSDPNAGMQLHFSGKMRVSGDMMLAMKLQQLFALVTD